MMSGGRILWNAIAICEMFKTSWTDGKFKMNEDWWISLGHALFAGWIGEEDILIAEIEELEKLDATEICPRRLNAREVLKTPKMENSYFLWQMVQQIVRKRLRIPRIHSEAGIHRKEERTSTESLLAIGKSYNLKKQKMTKESTRIFGLTQKLGKTFIYRHHIEPRSPTNVPREESFLIYKIYIIERNSSERQQTMREENWRNAKTSEAKTKSIIMILQGKDGILYLITTLPENSFWGKDLKKAFHPIFCEGESKHMLSRLAAQRICETKFFK